MAVFQNVGTPRYYGLNGVDLRYKAVEKAQGDKTLYKKNGMVIGGYFNGMSFNGVFNSRYNNDNLVSCDNIYSINNFNNYYDNVESGGLAILAVPVKICRAELKYDTIKKKYYQYTNDVNDATIYTYETFEYWIVSSLEMKTPLNNTYNYIKSNYQLKTGSINYFYKENAINNISEYGDDTKDIVDGSTQFTYFTLQSAMNNEYENLNIYNADNVVATYRYNKFFDGDKEAFLNDYKEIFTGKYTGNPIYMNTAYTLNDRFFQQALFRKIVTNIPIFTIHQVQEMFNYFQNGDMSGSANYDEIQLMGLDWSTDWKLYVDGKQPNLKLVWKSEALEKYLDSEENTTHITLDAVKVEISQNDINGKRVLLDYVPYTNGNYKTNYTRLAEKFDMTAWDKFLSNIIGNQTGIGDIPLYFKIYYGKLYSTLCYCKIPYSTAPTEYGRLPSIEIQDKSTVTVVYGSDGTGDDGYTKPTEKDDLPQGGTDGIVDGADVSGVFSRTYLMSNERINQLSSFLWGDNFFQNIKLLNSSPIENVVSCKLMPCTVSGVDEPITLGNVATGVNGDKTTSSLRVEIGSLNIPEYYHSFLDYAPYTKLTIFLPFIGFKEIDTNLFMGKTLTVYYVFDFITGAIKAQLYTNNIYVYTFDAIGGIDIPITASNRAQVESGYIKSALTVGAGIASGNALAIGGGILSLATPQYHYNTSGAFSPSCGFHDTRLVYVIYDRPIVQYPSGYNHNIGKPCKLSQNFNSLNGFTIVENGVELSSIPCTAEEREEILQLLSNGVYL